MSGLHSVHHDTSRVGQKLVRELIVVIAFETSSHAVTAAATS